MENISIIWLYGQREDYAPDDSRLPVPEEEDDTKDNAFTQYKRKHCMKSESPTNFCTLNFVGTSFSFQGSS